MDKVRIQEIAAEAGLSNGELLVKAKELGFDVKAANSSISMEEAGILVDYAISGTLPKSFKKPTPKSKITIIKKKPKEPAVEAEAKDSSSKKDEQKDANKGEEAVAKDEGREAKKDAKAIEEKASNDKSSKEKVSEEKTENETPQKTEERKTPKKKSLSRGGITIVRKAKRAPVKKKISMADSSPAVPKKKKPKKVAEAKDSGEKLDIMGGRDFSGSDEIYDEAEVVLLDFSDKNIYEEMKRQDERRKAEQKKRGPQANTFRPQHNNTFGRGRKKRKRYPKPEESSVKVSTIEIPENVRVYEFAEKVGRSVGEVVKVLFTLGTMVTKNDFLDKDDIEILSDEFEVEVTTVNPLDALDYSSTYDAVEDENPQERPPVITIMGHVDHGKTSLLDRIRSTKVVDREAGGITQHVGAYQVEKNGKKITFVDTPGHSAFTEMRARGAQATDIVIIVVAADDGVKPQTKEAISHAKAAGVPLIVAINKMDKESANPEMVKSQLAELEVLSVDWGGENEFVEVSAHSGMGIDELLDVILLQAEVMELKADPTRLAKAIVVESSLEKGFGPVANIIVKNGTLKVGDSVIVGNTFGRVRTMRGDDGSILKEAGPGTPVAVVGLNQVPSAGDVLVSMENERDARELADKRAEYARSKELSKSTKATLDDLSSLIAEGQLRSLPVILKADVQGSLEAIKGALGNLKNEEVKVNVIHEGVGGVTESDVALADASENSIILGFNVRPTGSVKKRAKELGVEIKSYSIIYDLLDDVKALLGGMMSPVVTEEVTGQAEVRETFTVGKVGTIAGSKVIEGSIQRGSKARLIRDGVVIYTSTISSLKRFTEDAKEVKSGYECGIMLENFNDIKAGDIFETFKDVEEQVVL
ncbi:Translation initiation factor 2 [hydrothermal vent metagenome]|uniref:Translation initiation factor 2 n=1 Tax=hydrothermal vent metagenome TaxID=652676 RepID=A0A1W1BCJ9_9ZZZZ